MKDEERIQKVNTDRIEGEYILKDTDADKKKIVFSTVIWYDPETGKYYFKSESDMGGDTLAGQIVSHKLIQDLLSISKWMLKPIGELWDDGKRTRSGGVDIDGDGVKCTGTPYKWSAKYEADMRRALESQDDQKKTEGKRKGWGKGTPAQREEKEKRLAAIKREGCCPRCHRRIIPEHQSTFDEHYLCKWCDQKRSNCKESEYSDHTKEDSK